MGYADLNSGGVYNPTADSWSATSLAQAPKARWEHTAVWDGDEMLVFGGESDNASFLADGGRLCALDGDFDGAVEMMHRIAKTVRARQSIIRHMFRFFMGRNETLNDSRTLREADQAYVKSGGSFRAVVVALLSSDSFLYRR